MSDLQPPVKPFDYAAFIAELRRIITSGERLIEESATYDSAEFSLWRHTLEDLIGRIGRKRYSVNTKQSSRLFRVNSSYVNKEGQQKAFYRDMSDTIAELQFVVQMYEKYGDPKMSTAESPIQIINRGVIDERVQNAVDAVPAKTELESPEKITLYWLIKHMTLSGWGILGALLVTAYTVGVTVGGWPITQKLLAHWFGVTL